MRAVFTLNLLLLVLNKLSDQDSQRLATLLQSDIASEIFRLLFGR